MFYFSEHPTIRYDMFRNGRAVAVTDITRRFKLNTFFKDNALIMYDYNIQDSDRPDIIAEKYYEDSSLDWLIFLTNNIIDPYFEWPLKQYDFDQYIRQKYGSVENAMQTHHHYEWVVTPSQRYTNSDGEEVIIAERVIIIDQAAYNTTSPNSRRDIDCYEHEIALNENRRSIKILDKAFVPSLRQAMEGIFD